MKSLINYAMSFIGVPYSWGGDNAIEGFDCSGLAQEILSSIGMDPPGRDTAQSLYNFFSINGIVLSKPAMGALLFYGDAVDKITHVAFAINEFQMIEAGGGDRTCTTREISASKNATVRIRLFTRRNDLVKAVMPQYPAWIMRDI